MTSRREDSRPSVGDRRARPPVRLAVVLALAALGWGRLAAAQAEAGLELKVQVGLAGYWREERWTPVRVQATNRGPDIYGELSAQPVGGVGAEPCSTRAVELPRDSTKVYWLYLHLPGGAPTVRVAVTRAGRDVAGGRVDVPVPTWPPGPALGLLNAAATGRPALAAALDSQPNVVALAPGDLPDAWPGYDGLDVAVIRLTGQPLFAEEAGARAFAEWLRAGGRAVVVAPGGAAAGAPLADLLPARLGVVMDLAPPAAVAAFAGATAPPAQPFPATRLEAVQGDTLLAADAAPLAVRDVCGLGEVTLLAFDPFAPPFDRWPGTPALWRRLLAGDRFRERKPRVLFIGGTPEQARDFERLTPWGAQVERLRPEELQRRQELLGSTDLLIEANGGWTGWPMGIARRMSIPRILLGGPTPQDRRARDAAHITVSLDAAAAVAAFAGAPPPASRPCDVIKAPARFGQPLLLAGTDPLVVRDRNSVALLFDPGAPPFDGWAGRPAFWRRIYEEFHGPSPGGAQEWLTVARRLAFESIFGRVRFGRLRLLLGLYVLLLWPVSWLVVRRLRRAVWTWVLLLGWAGAFGGVVGVVGMEGRPSGVVLRQVSVLDLPGDGSVGAGRTLACLYSPWGGRYDVRAADPAVFLRPLASRSSEHLAGSAEGAGAEACLQDLGTQLRGVQVPGGMVRQIEGRWREVVPAGDGVVVTLTEGATGTADGLLLTLENRSDAPLRRPVLLAGNRYWEGLPDVAPRATASVPLGGTPRRFLPALRELQGSTWGTAHRSPFDWETAAQRAADELYSHSANADPIVDQWLCSGGKVLLAESPRSPCPLLADGRRLPTQELCVVRVYFR